MEGSTMVVPTQKHEGLTEAVKAVSEMFPKLPTISLHFLKKLCNEGGIDGSKLESGILAILMYGSRDSLDENGSSNEELVKSFFRWNKIKIQEDLESHPLTTFFRDVTETDTARTSPKLHWLRLWCERTLRSRPADDEEPFGMYVG